MQFETIGDILARFSGYPRVSGLSVEKIYLDQGLVVRLSWEGVETPVEKYLVFRGDRFSGYLDILGFSEVEFFDYNTGLAGNDFRYIPSWFFFVGYADGARGERRKITLNREVQFAFPPGIYILLPNTLSEVVVVLDFNGTKKDITLSPSIGTLLLIADDKADFKFTSQQDVSLSFYTVGGLSNVASIFDIDSQVSSERLGNYLDRILKEEVRRVVSFYYPNFGEEFYLLVRKRAGERCSRCWSNLISNAIDPQCPICYGTGYVGGYVAYPMLGQFQYPRETYVYGPTERGEWLGPRTFELTCEPKVPIKPRDVVVRKDGTRYIVGRVNYTRIAGAIIHQSVNISLVDKEHPVNKIPVNLAKEGTSIEFSPIISETIKQFFKDYLLSYYGVGMSNLDRLAVVIGGKVNYGMLY